MIKKPMFEVEKDWTTKAGLRAVCTISGHRCGYVGIDETHPLFGTDYNKQSPHITQTQVNNTSLGQKSPILILCATVGSDGDNLIKRAPEILFDCHGGLTYSGKGNYPVESNLWWYGFDCAHYDDTLDPKSFEFVVDQCESLAEQLVSFQTTLTHGPA